MFMLNYAKIIYFLDIFKALALWANAFYKLICPSVCPSVCVSVRPPYQKFWMILSLVSNIFWNRLVFKIFNEGFMVNQHSKSVTKQKCELQLHLALQQYILSASAFYTKRYICQLSFIWHLENLYSLYGGWARTVAVKSYFWWFCRILLVMSAQALVSAQNPPKMTLYGNCHSSAPIIAAQVCKVPYQR